MFNVHGEGTRNLSDKKPGDMLDIIAPLGKGFRIDEDFDHAIIIAGGIGVAPFPLLTKRLTGKKVTTFLGGRSATDIVTYGLENVITATDDGSLGVKGTVVDLFSAHLDEFRDEKIKVFACGPSPMLRVLQQLLLGENINGEISTECAMACGFGICQGCPVENSHDETKYLLVCKDGPVFNVKDVVI
ncbi:MAG: dihydroorotate dehydrogenase electron transfer subunit [Bacteroidetes bacterium]|nr:dihydroorotate dehydrogenase electron transfer subunit [Bacteroidota bacterium]